MAFILARRLRHKQEKAKHVSMIGLYLCLATTYSPPHFRVQYNRPCGRRKRFFAKGPGVGKHQFKVAGKVGNWDDLIRAEKKYSHPREEWVFRGESQDRPLQSTLERLKSKQRMSPDIRALESQFFNDFKRSFRIHSPAQDPQTPDDNVLYWLSLMRHFGTPTRILDFTYSLFVATFFALERQQQTNAVVWLISKTWLTRHNVKAMYEQGAKIDIDGKRKRIGGEEFCKLWGRRDPRAFREIFWNRTSKYVGVFPVNPAAYHQRLHLQQGLFLCPAKIEESFSDNLKAYDGYEDKGPSAGY
jgi:hypothetical protein